MKKTILIFIIFSILFGSCSSNKAPPIGISTHSSVPSSTSTPVPPSPTTSPTSVPTPEPFLSLTSTENIVSFSLEGKEILIELIPQEGLDSDNLEISALDIKDHILIEIIDPQEVYLPYIGFITKTQEESIAIEVVLPPKELFAVSYGPYDIDPGDLDLELVAEISLDELSAQISQLEETGSISILIPNYGEGIIYPDLEVYKINHLSRSYLILPSKSFSSKTPALASPTKVSPLMLIPITFLIYNGDQVLDTINDIIHAYGFNIDTMDVLPGVTYAQWMAEGQSVYAIVLNTPSLPPPIEIRAVRDKYAYVSSSQPMTLYFSWYANTTQQVVDYINNMYVWINLDNHDYTGSFGPILNHESGKASEFKAYLPGLPPGVYQLKMTWELSQAVSDGTGTYGPGVVYDNTITIYVE